ncbi:MAG: ArsB/NhaD family transporter [Coriobacteriia bacterium]|nr:ArsB/NhaD family transporter [Coriobacteriia bacterium]MCL2750934.1 ArsB/NhaD family transporter [Coriobacteriia bacterium]
MYSIDWLPVVIAGAIFVTCYAFIISEKINRAIVAICGAVLLVMLGIVDLHVAYTQHIHWATIFLLLGMMILVAIATKSGIIQYAAIKAAQSAKGDPFKILVRLAVLTAVGSAFIDNVTMVLLIAPITIAIARTMNVSPIPYLITQILICNIGGAATLVGDPPNIMIGTAAGISFNDFLIHLTPIIVILMVLTIFIAKRYFAKSLYIEKEDQARLMEIVARDAIRDSKLAKKSIFVFALTLLGFFTHQYLHIEPATIALFGAALLMLLSAKDIGTEEVFHGVEWITIFFFAGLFVLVGGLVDVGIIPQLATWMLEATGGDVGLTAMILLWGAGIASGFVDNIPLVATMIPMVQDMIIQLDLSYVDSKTLWWALALGACLGGNGTLIASSANLIVAQIAAREGTPISFISFLKISVPVTLITLAIASVYVYIFFVTLGLS